MTYQYYAQKKIQARVKIDYQPVENIFVEKDSNEAILLIHGFSIGPQEFSPLMPYLDQRDVTYLIPNLSGHNEKNTTKLKKIGYQNWEKEVLESYEYLSKTYSQIDVIGFSNGANLALKLSEQVPIRNLILINPFSYPNQTLSKLHKLSQIKAFYIFSRFFIGYVPMDPGFKRPVYQYPYVPYTSLVEVLNLQASINFNHIQAQNLYLIYAKKDELSNYPLLVEEKLSPQLKPENILVLENSSHRALEENELDRIIKFLNHIT